MESLSPSTTPNDSMFVVKAFSSNDPHIPPTKTISMTCHSPPSNAFPILAPDCYVVALLSFSSSLVHPHSSPSTVRIPIHSRPFPFCQSPCGRVACPRISATAPPCTPPPASRVSMRLSLFISHCIPQFLLTADAGVLIHLH